jgi:hypothetical protein
MIWNIFEKFNNSPAGLFPLTILSRVRGGAGGDPAIKVRKVQNWQVCKKKCKVSRNYVFAEELERRSKRKEFLAS